MKESVREKALLYADRRIVASVLNFAVFLITILIGQFGPVSAERFLLGGMSPVMPFVELQTIVVTVATIVLSINQLVLSPKLGSIGKKKRLEDLVKFHDNVENTIGRQTLPPEPSNILAVILEGFQDSYQDMKIELEDVVEDSEQLAELEDLFLDLEDVINDLQSSNFGQIDFIRAILRIKTSEISYRLQTIRDQHGEDITENQSSKLEEVITVLELYSTAEEFFKTRFIQSEYINFSRILLYISLPALVIGYLATQIYDPSVFPGKTVGIRNQLIFIAASFSLVLSPFILMISYIARL